MPLAVEALSKRSAKFAGFSCSPAKPSMSSAKRRLAIVLPPMLTMPSCSSWVTDEAYFSVVLLLLQVAFLWKCDNNNNNR